MPGNPATVNAVIQFTGATGAVWTNLTTPVPNGIVTIESDTGIMKRGDGVTLYANLPTFFNLSTLTTLMTGTVQKTAAAALSGDLENTLTLFGINASGNVVRVTAADVWNWLVNSEVLQSIGGVVNVG